jgi:hypothetical protein
VAPLQSTLAAVLVGVWQAARVHPVPDSEAATVKLVIEGRMHPTKRAAAKVALRALTSGGFVHYQPVEVDGRRFSSGERGVEERLAALLPVLAEAGVDTVLDLGSAEGYVSRRCAESGHPTLGVEYDLRRLMVAQLSTSLDGIDDLGFWRMLITPQTIRRLPEVDGTVCLSLLHHIIYEHDLNYGKSLLKAIRAKTRRVLIFEMGQPNESTSPWAAELPDMGPDPHAWIAALLAEVGYTDVRKIAELPGWQSGVVRATFAAS